MSGKSKVVKSGHMKPVNGGKGHMFGKQHAGPKKPGVSGKADTGNGGKYARGGGTGYVGRQGKSTPSVPGKVSTSRGR
jgi:hypothetical protein